MSTYGYLAHHGIKGQKWGVRRYENPDGTLTEAGKLRYGRAERKEWKRSAKENYREAKKKFKSGELGENSKEFENAKRDRYMAKHGSAKDIDAYRYGTKEEKNSAILNASKRKKGKIATGVALTTVGTATIAGTAVAGAIIADVLAKIAGVAAVGTVAGVGTLTAAGVAAAGTASYNKKVKDAQNSVSNFLHVNEPNHEMWKDMEKSVLNNNFGIKYKDQNHYPNYEAHWASEYGTPEEKMEYVRKVQEDKMNRRRERGLL